jgi:predicted dehydrogenase
MLRIGLAGIGFMGWIHYLAYKKTKGARLAAICTRDERKLAGICAASRVAVPVS